MITSVNILEEIGLTGYNYVLKLCNYSNAYGPQTGEL